VFLSRSSRILRGGLVGAFALAIATATAPAGAFASGSATPIDFPTFQGASKMLWRNGSADILTSAGRVHQRILRLTAGGYEQAGSAWSPHKIDVSKSFESTFKVFLHHGQPGADGIAFLVQAEGPYALGGWGGGLGYRGIHQSVAIEFDTFQNTTDPSSNHLAVVVNGDPDHHLVWANPTIPLYGRPFDARVTYDAGSKDLKVYVQSLRAGAQEEQVLDHTIDLAAQVGATSAWTGFTGATGKALSKQDIYSWSVQGTEA
jgi:hypothetical protein